MFKLVLAIRVALLQCVFDGRGASAPHAPCVVRGQCQRQRQRLSQRQTTRSCKPGARCAVLASPSCPASSRGPRARGRTKRTAPRTWDSRGRVQHVRSARSSLKTSQHAHESSCVGGCCCCCWPRFEHVVEPRADRRVAIRVPALVPDPTHSGGGGGGGGLGFELPSPKEHTPVVPCYQHACPGPYVRGFRRLLYPACRAYSTPASHMVVAPLSTMKPQPG